MFDSPVSVADETAVTSRLLKGLNLVSLPVLLSIVAVQLAIGKGWMDVANLTLIALMAAIVVAALLLKSGRVKLSGLVLTYALWAAGVFNMWASFGFQNIASVFPLLAVLMACLILPWIAGALLVILSIGSLWLYALVRGLHGPIVPTVVEMSFASTAVFILVGVVALVCGRILRGAIRQTIAAQQALSNSEKQLHDILQTTPDLIYRLDSEGRIIFVNEAVRRYGYEPLKLIRTRFLDYVHPQDRDLATHRLDERRTAGRKTESQEIRLVTSWGEQRVVECAEMPVPNAPPSLPPAEAPHPGGTGQEACTAIQGIARDITDRKRAEEALKKSEEKYSKVFRAAPAGVAVASLDAGEFLDVNEEFERIFGFRRDELIGRSAFDIGLWPDPAEREHVVSLLRRGEAVQEVEVLSRTKNGDLRTVRYNAQQIDIGGTACLISAVLDVTERKRLESQLQQSQKLEAVGRLAGGIAHDFNNMLAVILGQAELASQALAPGNPAHESIQEIRKAADRSAELTRQLLVFARRQDANPRSLDLNDAISERLGMLRRLIGENIALKWIPAPGAWPVRMDSTQVDQILINLAVNARDAIADVGTLTISTENRVQEEPAPQPGRDEKPREWVVLTVTDTGKGMGNESLAHLFEPFFTTKEVGKGTGLGLATVYGIVQDSGGRIEVESQPGVGTSFRIYLPRTHEPAVHPGEASPTQLLRGRETVLVVEDEPAILKITRTTLQQLGYSVVAAASGKEALALAARHQGPLHLLLTDVIMPEMNGFDLYKGIATSRPGIKVVFASGYSADVFPEADDGNGGITFLQKPFTMRQLSAKVREVLDTKSPPPKRSRGG